MPCRSISRPDRKLTGAVRDRASLRRLRHAPIGPLRVGTRAVDHIVRIAGRRRLERTVRIARVAIALRCIRSASETSVCFLFFVTPVRGDLGRIDAGREGAIRRRLNAPAFCDLAVGVAAQATARRRVVVAGNQGVRIVEPDRVRRGRFRWIVAAPGLSVFHAAAIENGIPLRALRTGLPARRLRIDERLTVVDCIRLDAGIGVLVLPARQPELGQTYLLPRNGLARRRIDTHRPRLLAVSSKRYAAKKQSRDYGGNTVHHLALSSSAAQSFLVETLQFKGQ